MRLHRNANIIIRPSRRKNLVPDAPAVNFHLVEAKGGHGEAGA